MALRRLRKIISTLFIFPLGLVLAASAWAVDVNDLYQANVPVASQAPAERNAAIKQGLMEVLDKVSGNPIASENKRLSSDLKNAESFVQEYTYQIAPANTGKPYTLEIHFDRKAINQLLKHSGATLLARDRPLLMVWVAAQDQNHTMNILESDGNGDLQILINQTTKERAIPIVLPIMDMNDMKLVKPADVWNMSKDIITNASQRYASNGILVGRIDLTETDLVNSHWLLLLNNRELSWDIADKTAVGVMQQLGAKLNAAVVKPGAKPTTADTDPQTPPTPVMTVSLLVTGITQQTDIDHLLAYLKQLPPVTKVDLTNVAGDSVQVQVSVQGDKQSLVQAISLGHTLVAPSSGDESADTELVYQMAH